MENKEKYGFRPRDLLRDIVTIFLHLYQRTFVEAMAREGRSYKPELFYKACDILQKFGLSSEVCGLAGAGRERPPDPFLKAAGACVSLCRSRLR